MLSKAVIMAFWSSSSLLQACKQPQEAEPGNYVMQGGRLFEIMYTLSTAGSWMLLENET